MKIDFDALHGHLRGLDRYAQLTLYIFDIQGKKLAKLDYNAAAKALGVDCRSIGRYINKLVERRVLIFNDGQIKLSDEILKAG